MAATKREFAHEHEIGARVEVQVDDHRGLRWYPATLTGYSRIGTAYGDGWPTYDVLRDDGVAHTHASPECVRPLRAKRGAR